MSDTVPAFTLPSLIDVALRDETILASGSFSVPNAVPYTNISRENPEHGRHLEHEIYVARTGSLAEVKLVALSDKATILGGGHFVLKVAAALISEQYPPYFPLLNSYVDELLLPVRPVENVTGEALLVARYGISTWGHWLGELLPKIVLTEMTHPGRFSFVLPHQVLADRSPNLPWIRVKESLFAYGIEDSRIICLYPDRDYTFSSLFAVTPIWSNHLMHPGAMHAMRTRLCQHAKVVSPKRLAIERIPEYGRGLSNYREIRALLEDHNFESQITGSKPFLEQVSIFNQAELLFSILGSDLTNLIYAADGVKVITAAPAIFGDRFFYALILGRNGNQIDLRGPVTTLANDLHHKSMFALDPMEVAKAITMFTAA